ncbi:endonuclease/exonuclease/phosphatase family protein [Allorhizocola rhizosphaerae]|uniref:endonuclease/exonuclease/phosphatase family protein n=1 Tax=Allorhizocola rhizosphaerae TaxID=1872709 RepID=UPI000E3DFE42|nr:endonuclease/exonuclease/phosphatase family protein [Allorhizocola rhizosphaerae]
MSIRLATFNVENLFARAKALHTATWSKGRAALEAFETFNRIAAQRDYSDDDKAVMLRALETLRIIVHTKEGLRLNKRQFEDAWALLRENRGDFLSAPPHREPRIVAKGRGDWIGWVELATEPVDEIATRMTAQVIKDVRADVLCVVEAESRPSLARFNDELLRGRYPHAMLIDGNDLRGIDVGIMCAEGIDIRWMRSHVDVPDPANAKRRLFSRDCPVFSLRLPSGDDLFVMVNHLKSQSFIGGDPDPLRTRQADQVLKIYKQMRKEGAKFVAVVGDLNKGPDRDHPELPPPTLEALLGPKSPLTDAYRLPKFTGVFDPKDLKRERPGTFQSCTLRNRLDYILLSPELADRVVDGGIFRKGLWGDSGNVKASKHWTVYEDITAAKHAASDHAAVWVDLDF